MKFNPDTAFVDMQPGETITITVTAINEVYGASFPPALDCTSWSNIVGPANGKEVREFVAPASGDCFAVIVFNFQPKPGGGYTDGAKYTINVTGSNGGSHDYRPIEPPPLADRRLQFHVITK